MIFGPLFMTWVSLNCHPWVGLTLWLYSQLDGSEPQEEKKRGLSQVVAPYGLKRPRIQ